MKRSLVVVMAVSTGVTVATNYYAQPLLPAISRTLHLQPGTAGLIVTVAQVGYALGLVFLTPLGDIVHPRRIITALALITAVGLVVLGTSTTWAVLFPASLIVGAASSLAQIIVPFAATLAVPEERGRVVGAVMSGLLIGILCARTFAGLIAELGSWRTVYLVAAALLLVQAIVLHRALPGTGPKDKISYGDLLRSLSHLVAHERTLQLRGIYGLFSFATFSVLWTSLAFLLREHYHYSVLVIGLFGLIGASGALAASVAGRHSDSGRSNLATGITASLLVLSWFAIWWGRTSLVGLIIGIALLDLGVQGLHITNQGLIFRLDASKRSRLNAGYMTIYFIGGAIGSAVSAACYEADHWDGVCIAGAGFALGALVMFLVQNALGYRTRALPVAVADS